MTSLTKISSRVASFGAAAALFGVTVGANIIAPTYVSAAAASTVSTSPSQKAMVSFTFDDGLQSIYTKAAPALAEYGLTGTSYVISNCIGMTTTPNTCRADTTRAYMSAAEIKAVHDTYGWEIGSHTANHVLLASTDEQDQPNALTVAQVDQELADSKTKITEVVGVAPTAFASPYGDYAPTGNPTLAEVAKYYTSHRGFADMGYNVTPYNGGTLPTESVAINNYLLRDQQIQTTSNATTVTGTTPSSTAGPANVTVDHVKAMIDKAVTDKSWLVLTFHDIVDTVNPTTDDYDYSVANLKAIAAYVKSKQDAGQIKSVNVSDGIEKPATGTTPLIDESFANGLGAWTTDAPATIKADNGNHGAVEATGSVAFTSSATNTQLYAPAVTIDPNGTYIISCFVNIVAAVGQPTAIGEVGFFINEYDAAGTIINQVPGVTGGGYKMSVDAGAENPDVKQVSFTYKPTTTAFKAALQIIVVGNAQTTYNGYIDNVKMFAATAAATTPVTPVTPAPTTPVTGGKGGDLNGDNRINALDLSVLLSNWKKSGQSRAQGDLNGDGTVNALDLSLLLANWGK